MGEKQPFAGLGKLYFCSVEDMEKEPQPLGEPITIKPGMLTYKDDDEQPSYSPKGFNIGFDAKMEEPSPELMELLVTPPNRWDVQLECKPGRLPRKLKKAYEHGWLYHRITKWKRKAGNLRRCLLMTLRDAEIVINKEQRDRLAGTIDVEMTLTAARKNN